MIILDNNELLKAIGEMIDQKLEEKLEQKLNQKFAPITADIAIIKEDVAVLKEDVAVLKEDVAVLKEDVATNKKDIASMNTHLNNLEKRTDRLEILLEHEIPKSIRLLAEGHGAILEKIIDKREIDDIKDRVANTETVISIHTKEIEILKRAR